MNLVVTAAMGLAPNGNYAFSLRINKKHFFFCISQALLVDLLALTTLEKAHWNLLANRSLFPALLCDRCYYSYIAISRWLQSKILFTYPLNICMILFAKVLSL